MPIHLQKEVTKLKSQLLTLGAMVEESVREAVRSLAVRDAEAARRVVEKDVDIDHFEVDVEEEGLKILALHQPVAIDLRFIIAVIKINNDLERIGDLAVNIAERTLFLAAQPRVDIPFDFPGLSEKAQAMLKKSLDALVNLDAPLARSVCAMDDEVDAINREMYEKVKSMIRLHPEHVDSLIAYLSVSRCLERIADHATNIAEDVMYMTRGDIVRHKPSRFETSSSAT
jgi:phosphate transport system protein